jgi:catechol 2,3-dioxygenase-like lactoylglutathione lyase family enzyme
MLADAAPVCFILTADIAAARHYYSDTLGLRETGEDPYAVTYDLGGTMMRLTKVDAHQPSGHTVIGWQVADIAGEIDALTAKGVTFAMYEGFGQDERGVWTDPGSGTKIAWFNDPEGNNLSLTEFAR